MAIWIDNEFAYRALAHLPKFRQINNSSIFKLNFRCPVCGDSQTDMNKARGWYYGNGDHGAIHCYNCGNHQKLSSYLNEYEPDLYREYILEQRKEKGNRPEPVKEPPKPEAKIIKALPTCVRLDKIPHEHPIIKYVQNRKIPEHQWGRLWFTNEWPALCNKIKAGTYKKELSEPRLVIPIFNKDGKAEAFQGRALRKDAPQKYITIKAYENATKIYGVERVDESKPVIVLEGPLDSLFLDNAIAITGGQLDLDLVPFKEQRIWVMDAESRHPDTIKRMTRLIEAGEKVLFWDLWKVSGKDINEFIQNGSTPEQVQEYILSNFEQGLKAKLRLQRYSKI